MSIFSHLLNNACSSLQCNIICKMAQFLSTFYFTLLPFQLEKGVDGLYDSFARLDSRISSVGQTAAKIGDHLQVKYLWYYDCLLSSFCSMFLFTFNLLSNSFQPACHFHVFVIRLFFQMPWFNKCFPCQSADSQRETASQTIDLIKVGICWEFWVAVWVFDFCLVPVNICFPPINFYKLHSIWWSLIAALVTWWNYRHCFLMTVVLPRLLQLHRNYVSYHFSFVFLYYAETYCPFTNFRGSIITHQG